MQEKYEEKYGHIPDTREQILNYIEENFKLNMEKIQEEEDFINSLKWKDVEMVLPLVPKPTPRPRYAFKTKHFYVQGAADNKKFIKEYIDDLNIIYTRTKFIVKTYQPTPISGMKPSEIYLAEKGVLCPLSTPDWDNLGKTYSDMLQDVLFLNDNIIQTGIVEKYYSLKPRIELFISYQDDFDSNFNKKRIENSKAYKALINE